MIELLNSVSGPHSLVSFSSLRYESKDGKLQDSRVQWEEPYPGRISLNLRSLFDMEIIANQGFSLATLAIKAIQPSGIC
jgi:hypothetical protein